MSRHFKVTTAQELKALLERPVPKDLLALVIDAKYFPKPCIIVAIGIDKEGRKHVLGLWEGATELDGGKALRKAVQQVLGNQAVVQRCRVHKQRNGVEHLPQDKQSQAIWRLRAAWAKSNPHEAQKELQRIVHWLEHISPMAARSLQEGLEETLTLQKLGINRVLAQTLSSTNMIESLFAQAGLFDPARQTLARRQNGPALGRRHSPASRERLPPHPRLRTPRRSRRSFNPQPIHLKSSLI